MNPVLFAIAATTFALTSVGHAEPEAYTDYAHVRDVQPVYDLVCSPVRERQCWEEEVTQYHSRDPYTAMITGSIIGGVIGNQFGGGHGRDAATVAGALLGGSIGRDVVRRGNAQHRHVPQQHCQVVTRYVEEERLAGYRVTYEYDGHVYVRTLSRDPGDRLRVRVAVTPVDQ